MVLDNILNVVAIIGIILFFPVLFAIFKHKFIIRDRWQDFYDNVSFSTTDFYLGIKDALEERKIEGLKFSTQTFRETHFLSAKREYLRIDENEWTFYICAATFGTGMFASWWLEERDMRLLNKIPILNKWFGKDRLDKTFYQLDTEAMYKSAINAAVQEMAHKLTEEKGYRKAAYNVTPYKFN